MPVEVQVQVLCDGEQIGALLGQLAESVAAAAPADGRLALVGIRSRGEIIAQRLLQRLQARGGVALDVGVLDITLYRDDLDQLSPKQPAVRSTEIDFPIDGRVIVLVDDVLNTGRSTRAALDALLALGRPRAIRLAVLIDRGNRELPISADFVGRRVETRPDQRVSVFLQETDGRDEVVVQ